MGLLLMMIKLYFDEKNNASWYYILYDILNKTNKTILISKN